MCHAYKSGSVWMNASHLISNISSAKLTKNLLCTVVSVEKKWKTESSWAVLLGPLPYLCVWVEINGLSLNFGIFTCYFHPWKPHWMRLRNMHVTLPLLIWGARTDLCSYGAIMNRCVNSLSEHTYHTAISYVTDSLQNPPVFLLMCLFLCSIEFMSLFFHWNVTAVWPFASVQTIGLTIRTCWEWTLYSKSHNLSSLAPVN